jgi:hypothetical protein
MRCVAGRSDPGRPQVLAAFNTQRGAGGPGQTGEFTREIVPFRQSSIYK